MLIICQIDWREVGVAFELQCLRNCTLSSFLLFTRRLFSAPAARPGANVYQTFGHRCSYYQWPIDLPYPPLIFTAGQKVRFLALLLTSARSWAAVVWTPSKLSSPFLNLVCSDDLTMSQPNLVQIGPHVLIMPIPVLEHPLRTDEKSVVIIHNSAADWLISRKFGMYIDHDTTHVQGQRVSGQGHSVT